MRITTKRAKKASKPVTVRLDDRALAIARAEARAAGMSLSGYLAKIIQASAGQRPEQALQEDVQQVAQAAMLASQLAVEVLSHVQIMQMPSPAQRQQIEQKRSELYALHFSPSDHNPDEQRPERGQVDNGIQEAEL